MANFSYTTQFIDSPLGKTIQITDTTDYVGIGLDIADVSCTIDIVFSDGTNSITVHTGDVNNFDIVPATSRVNITPIDLPLDSDGEILLGQYTVTVRYYDHTVIPPDLYDGGTITNIYNFQCPCPEPDLSIVVDCGNSTITVTDDTDYGANVTSLSRVMKLYPPPVLNLPPYTTSASTLTVTGIFTKTWTAEVITDVVYTFPDGSSLAKQIVGVKEFDVECDDDVCKILCCIRNLKNTYDRLLCKNPIAAQALYDDKLGPIQLNAMLFQLYTRCGDSTKAASYLQEIKEISNCTDDCAGCDNDSDEPISVIPSTATDSVAIVDNLDGSITVTSNTVGDTTTYHVKVSTAIQNLLNSIRTSTVSTGTPSFLAVTTSSLGINTNYQVNWIGTIPAPVNRLEYRLSIQLNTLGFTLDYFTLTRAQIANVGSTVFQPSGSINWKLGTNTPNTANDFAIIEIQNFLIQPLTVYSVHAQVMNVTSVGTSPQIVSQVSAEVFWFDPNSDHIKIRLYETATGQPWTLGNIHSMFGGSLLSPNSLYLSLSIFA